MLKSCLDTKHVPCKFFRQGTCQAGNACPFSHSLDPVTQTQPCKYFQKVWKTYKILEKRSFADYHIGNLQVWSKMRSPPYLPRWNHSKQNQRWHEYGEKWQRFLKRPAASATTFLEPGRPTLKLLTFPTTTISGRAIHQPVPVS